MQLEAPAQLKEEVRRFWDRQSCDTQNASGEKFSLEYFQEIERIRAQAATLSGPQRLEVLRGLGSGTRQCKLDKAGRLVLPPEFCRLLHLSGEVTLAGAIETFEIWNAKAWDNAKSKNTALATPHLADFGL